MELFYYLYITIPVAFVLLLAPGNYRPTNWIWLVILIISLFLGIGPYIAIAYIIYALSTRKTIKNSSVEYGPDGSYTKYGPGYTKSPPKTGEVALKVFGGILAGVCVAFGLLVIGIFIAILTYKPPAGSKTM